MKPTTRALIVPLLALLAHAPAWSADTPGDTYLAYHKLVVSAKQLSDLDPLLCQKHRQTDASLPPEKQEQVLSLMQKHIPTEVEYLKTVPHGADKADVYVASKGGKKLFGRVEMVREDGAWKLLKEHWSSHDTTPR